MNKLEGYDPTIIIQNLDDYQEYATGTAIYPGQDSSIGLIYTALKMNGEAGEFAEHVGKAMRDDSYGKRIYNVDEDSYSDTELTQEREDLLAKELGDILWYIAAAANELGFDLSLIANLNLRKLYDRKQRGVLSGSGDTR